MLSKQMRDINTEHTMLNPSNWNSPFAEQDIRFAEFVDWLQTQDQTVKDAVTLSMHLTVAFQAKFSPLVQSSNDMDVLKRVEEAQKRLGIDFLYTESQPESSIKCTFEGTSIPEGTPM